MENYPGRIQIRVAREADLVVLRIQDNGGGIDPEFLPMVFDAYVTSRAEKGTGIGLYMTRIILEKKLRGSIHLANSGEGLLAELKFPLSRKDGSAESGKKPSL